jgi:hypothetical protein
MFNLLDVAPGPYEPVGENIHPAIIVGIIVVIVAVILVIAVNLKKGRK